MGWITDESPWCPTHFFGTHLTKPRDRGAFLLPRHQEKLWDNENLPTVPPKEHRFSATNQPSREAKSAGLRRWQERNRLKENLMRVFTEELPGLDGTKTVAMAAIARRVRDFLLEKNPKGMSAKQVELALKTFDLLAPADSKIDLTLKTEKISEEELKAIMAERLNVATNRNAPGDTK